MDLESAIKKSEDYPINLMKVVGIYRTDLKEIHRYVFILKSGNYELKPGLFTVNDIKSKTWEIILLKEES
jgi:hypothetical protein